MAKCIKVHRPNTMVKTAGIRCSICDNGSWVTTRKNRLFQMLNELKNVISNDR